MNRTDIILSAALAMALCVVAILLIPAPSAPLSAKDAIVTASPAVTLQPEPSDTETNGPDNNTAKPTATAPPSAQTPIHEPTFGPTALSETVQPTDKPIHQPASIRTAAPAATKKPTPLSTATPASTPKPTPTSAPVVTAPPTSITTPTPAPTPAPTQNMEALRSSNAARLTSVRSSLLDALSYNRGIEQQYLDAMDRVARESGWAPPPMIEQSLREKYNMKEVEENIETLEYYIGYMDYLRGINNTSDDPIQLLAISNEIAEVEALLH